MTPAERTLHARDRALEVGFDWFGVARAERLEEDYQRLQHWLAEGRGGDMAEWLAPSAELRADPELSLPQARSVCMVGMNYQVAEIPEAPAAGAGKVSRFARGRDYHKVFDKRLKRLARSIARLGPEGAKARSFVDLGAIMERPWAARAGLGFIGKNTLLIHPEQGSWFFLGAIITTVELEPTVAAASASCGDCRRCLDACPTGAITEPYRLDSRRCLSYLTIEKQGFIEPASWDGFQGWVYGCDVCQDVCPFNGKRARPQPADRFAPPMVPAGWSLVEMLQLTPESLEDRFPQSPVHRAGALSLVRNGAIASSRRGGVAELADLERLAADDAQPGWLRETARVAAEQLRRRLS